MYRDRVWEFKLERELELAMERLCRAWSVNPENGKECEGREGGVTARVMKRESGATLRDNKKRSQK